MEKFSKWRDPATGIQPFLPQVAPSSPLATILLPLALLFGVVRMALLIALALVHFVFVHLLLSPLGAAGRVLSTPLTALFARLALVVLGYYSIPSEIVQDKSRRRQGVAQAVRGVQRGDLIIASWSSYVDVLFYAFRHNPTFVLPVFEVSAPTSSSFGRSSGTGSAAVLLPPSSGVCVGYTPVPILSMIASTGSLPPTVTKDAKFEGTLYRTLAEARAKSPGPVLLFPEATTSNGRAVLKFGEGVIAEEPGKEGVVWIKFMRHGPPTPFLPAAPCPLPSPVAHLFQFACTLPLPRSAAVRTLHPNASPSSPSFLLSEILASQPGGLAAARKETTAWRDACAVVLAETGRTRRVVGMGWEEKGGFLEYYAKTQKK